MKLPSMQPTCETEYLQIFDFSIDETFYRVALTKVKADKRVSIHCSNNQILWEQLLPNGHIPLSEKAVICQPSQLLQNAAVSILVISGKPSIICGLDEGRIASAKCFDPADRKERLYVMSQAAFRAL